MLPVDEVELLVLPLELEPVDDVLLLVVEFVELTCELEVALVV